MRYFFDLDGTLIDSSRRHAVVLSVVLSEYGLSIPIDRLEDFVSYKSHGFSTLDYLNNILGIDVATSHTISHRWVERIEDSEFLVHDTLYDDVFPVLDSFISSDEILFISARKNSESLMHELDSLGILKYAKHVFVVDPIYAAVEKKNVLLQFGNSIPTLLIGDTEVEYHASLDTGISVLLLNRGFRSKEYWDKLGISSYSNLHDALHHYHLSSISAQANNVVRK